MQETQVRSLGQEDPLEKGDQEGRRGTDEVMPGTSVFSSSQTSVLGTHVAGLEFPREDGLILRCAVKAGNPFQTTQGPSLHLVPLT